jgi:hypothetical protein
LHSDICFKYDRLINDELAASLQFHDNIIVQGLTSNWKIEPLFIEKYGLPKDLTLYDITKKSVEVIPKMRFIYLTSLLEAFMKEYISQRSSIPMDEIKKVLNQYNSDWDRNHSGKGSKSLLNINYSLYVLHEEYGIIFNQNDFNEITYEIGAIRNVIVHHEGLVTGAFLPLVQKTLTYVDSPFKTGVKISLNNEMLWKYVDDFRELLKKCDYE